MITICIAGGCFAIAIVGYRIGTIYGYILSGVSVVVGSLLFLNGLRVIRERKANAKIASRVERQLGKFLYGCGFKTAGEVPFNHPFVAFDNVSAQLLCGMPMRGCACAPFGKLLGFRIYEKGEASIESQDFDEQYDSLFPESEEDFVPESKGLAIVFLFDDKKVPLYEIEFAEAFYPKNSYFYRDELKLLKKYAETAERLMEEYEIEEEGSVKVWQYEE